MLILNEGQKGHLFVTSLKTVENGGGRITDLLTFSAQVSQVYSFLPPILGAADSKRRSISPYAY